MTKEEIEKALGIPRRTLDRTIMRCDQDGLLQPAVYGEGNRREFTDADFQAISDRRKTMGAAVVAIAHNGNGTARHGTGGGQGSRVRGQELVRIDKPDVNTVLATFSEKIGAVIEAKLFVE